MSNGKPGGPGGELPAIPHIAGKLDYVKASNEFARFWRPDFQCPICGKEKTYTFGPDLVTLTFNPNPFAPTYTLPYPCVVVICSWCGHTLFFNAIRLGLTNV
jgi:hypothetical protein